MHLSARIDHCPAPLVTCTLVQVGRSTHEGRRRGNGTRSARGDTPPTRQGRGNHDGQLRTHRVGSGHDAAHRADGRGHLARRTPRAHGSPRASGGRPGRRRLPRHGRPRRHLDLGERKPVAMPAGLYQRVLGQACPGHFRHSCALGVQGHAVPCAGDIPDRTVRDAKHVSGRCRAQFGPTQLAGGVIDDMSRIARHPREPA